MTAKSMRPVELPLLGSNQDSSDPESVDCGRDRGLGGDNAVRTPPKSVRSTHESTHDFTPRQRDLFTPPAHRLPESVTADLMRAVEYFRAHDLPFTAEMIRDRCSDSTRATLALEEHRNGLGGFVQSLSRGRTPKIRSTGFADSHRDAARGRPLRVWRAA